MRRPHSLLPLLTVAAIAGGAAPSLADPITYTETVTGSGQINDLGFRDLSVVLTVKGDTADVFKGTFSTIFGQVAVDVVGVGSAVISGLTEVFDDETTGIAGFKAVNSADILDTEAAAFSTYGLTTSIGPVSGTALFGLEESFPTTNTGSFALEGVERGQATFTATLGSTATAPEPAGLALLGIGLAGFAAVRRRKA